MYNTSFDDTIRLIKNNILVPSDYHKDLFRRLQDDDNYDVWYCLTNNLVPDGPEKFLTFEDFLNYVYEKCRNNIYYFLKNIIRLPSKGGGFMNFELNIGTLALIEHYIHGTSALLQNPRQTFQSTTLSCIMEYESMFKPSNATTSMLCRTPLDFRLHMKQSMCISGQIPDTFKNYVASMVSNKPSKSTTDKKIVFIDDFEFHEDLKNALSLTKENCDREVVYYAASVVNRNLTEDEERYLNSITINSVDNFNIFSPLVDVVNNDCLVRIWYDSQFFFTSEEHKELLTTLGPDTYESEILRIRTSEKS